MTLRISVFGGSLAIQGEPDYEEGMKLGKMLAQSGYTVLTGGYMGTMEAVSKGAAEAGGHVIGVTCDEIENWRPLGPNRWIQEEIRSSTLVERLNTLIRECDAAVALQGGIGTLTEISLMWTLMSINSISDRYLILVGKSWRETLTSIIRNHNKYIGAENKQLLAFADDVENAIRIIEGISL